MIAAFHFLRPWWLLLVPTAALLLWLWHRRADPRAQWSTMIAPHLLDALLVGATDGVRWQPIHLTALALGLAGIAAAGPTWDKEPPPFGDDRAPMMIAIDLSPSMDATDVAPTRLERVKQKVHDLVALRVGARTGLVVYAGTAHLVLPPAEDPALLALFLDALATDLMPVAGRHIADALARADGLLEKESAPGTVLFFSDAIDTGEIPAFAERVAASRSQVLILGVGTAAGGPIRTKDGGVATDDGGRPLTARFDAAAFDRLAAAARVPIAGVTVDDTDVRWVQRRAQHHLELVEQHDVALRWREHGYWLTFPIALLTALWFRRGWVVRWLPAIAVIATLGVPDHASAAASATVSSAAASTASAPEPAPPSWLADLFLTPDQQGRWYFDHGDYATAAARFADPIWKGIAFHRAGNDAAALGELARRSTPDAFFLMGNCYARMKAYAKAVAAYDNALAGRTAFPEATANRALVAALSQKPPDDEAAQDPNLQPDDIAFDDKGKKGTAGRLAVPLADRSAELWMRNLTVSPADFLRRKFRIQAEATTAEKAVTP